jgi:hypothetical protein
LEDAIKFLYPPHILPQPFACLKCALLSPKNVNIDPFNNHILEQLPEDDVCPSSQQIRSDCLIISTDMYFSANFIKENDEMSITHADISLMTLPSSLTMVYLLIYFDSRKDASVH